MFYSRKLGLIYVCAAILLLSLGQSHAIGVPSAGSLIGQEIASSYASDALQQLYDDMSGSPKGMQKALKKYERKLKKLMKKHAKKRKREEQTLQRMIDDLARYTPGDPDTNRKQQEKQNKINDYAQQCRENDRMRADEIEQLRETEYPKLKTF